VTDLEHLRRKRSALAVPSYRLPTYVKTVVGTERQVARELRRASRAGTLADTGERQLITRGQYAGQFQLRLVLLDQPDRATPRWARACLYLGWAFLTLATLAGMLAWLLTTLSMLALGSFLAFILVGFSIFLRARLGGRNITVIQSVQIR
jgi:hypothetical protein